MVLNWNEIKSRALLFSKTWGDASNEDSLAKPFWIAFFEIFGITHKRSWPGFAGEALSVKHCTAIEQAAQGVLNARAQFARSSLADICDPLTMPPALLKAHQKLDAAVDAAYQPSGGKKSYASDAERVAFLFDLYQRITSLLPVQAVKKTRKSKTTESH
jgi:hypothetical protein